MEYSCRPPYQLKEPEKELANDNGCINGYNLDSFDLCRACRGKGFSGVDVKFQPSDCLHFLEFPQVQSLHLTYRLFNYDYSLFNKSLVYKGFKGNELYFNKLLGERRNEAGKVIRRANSFFDWGGVITVTKTSKAGFINNCYYLVPDDSEVGYELTAAQGFFLDAIENDPTGKAKSQVGVYGANSPLNKFYCKRACPLGHFYDFDGTSCRKCYFGCAECKSYEKCDLCVPGFKKVKIPQHSSHEVDKSMINQCMSTCQPGFYISAFEGRCLECDENCEECVDSFFVYKKKFNNETHNPSFCLRCQNMSQKDDSGGVVVNLETGTCESNCSKKSKIGVVIPPIEEKFCYACPVGCKDCKIPDTDQCLSCERGYSLENQGKTCILFSETQKFKLYSIAGVGSVALICAFLIGLVIYKIAFSAGNHDSLLKDIDERKLGHLKSWKKSKNMLVWKKENGNTERKEESQVGGSTMKRTKMKSVRHRGLGERGPGGTTFEMTLGDMESLKRGSIEEEFKDDKRFQNEYKNISQVFRKK